MINKKTLFLVFAIFLAAYSFAQDTIKIMQYNLLNYGTTTGYCSESNNNTHDKDESIRTILEYVRPDIIAVNEFSKLPIIQTNFINNNLNIKGVNYWKSDNIINHAQSDIINHIFYNSDKMALNKHTYIADEPRDIDVYELYFKTNTLSMGDTTKLIYIIAHLKAGEGATNEGKRNAAAQKIMNYLANNHASDNVVISGDFNMYSADEPAYQKFTQSSTYGGALLIDPLGNQINNWGTGDFASYYTQSTHSSSNGCAAGGGLDDRFDIILISDEVRFGNKGIRYVTNSYEAVGNDGYHYNHSVNTGYNVAVGSEVANALYTVSDHLPVSITVTLTNPLGIDEPSQNANFCLHASPNPARDHITLHFNSDEPQIITFYILTTTGLTANTVQTYCESGSNTFRINTSNLVDGFYIVRMTNGKGQAAYCKVVVRK